MHPLQTATTYQLAIVVDTLLAERHLLQLHASLASHMSGADNVVQSWLDARRQETDANLADIYRLLMVASIDGDEDAKADHDQALNKARAIIRENCDLIDVDDLIASHRDARALDPDSDEASKALAEAEDALFTFRPATADQASARTAYMLSSDFVEVSCWDTEDLRTFLGSMIQ